MADLLTLPEIEAAMRRLLPVVGAGEGLLPTFGRTEDFARPHVEVDEAGYHWVVVERGQELERFTTRSLDALLEKHFAQITFGVAASYEREHRVPMQDIRRILFARQVELLARLSPVWAAREAARHAEILHQHPFDDRSDLRTRITVRLRDQGLDAEAAWDNACRLVPLPESDVDGSNDG